MSKRKYCIWYLHIFPLRTYQIHVKLKNKIKKHKSNNNNTNLISKRDLTSRGRWLCHATNIDGAETTDFKMTVLIFVEIMNNKKGIRK